ncbi:MAG: twin-arginine translocase subunit TatC, partial [Myxococcota bacterium]|nr:twin-arginine translocase subunit TatC [Myxococcota bacterium]
MTRPQPPSEFDAVESYRMPLIDHLVELRDRMVRILIVSAIGCGACFAFAQPIWDMLVDPMNAALQESGRGTMAITEPLEG